MHNRATSFLQDSASCLRPAAIASGLLEVPLIDQLQERDPQAARLNVEI